MVWRRRREEGRSWGTPWWSIVALVLALGVAFVMTEWLRSGRGFSGARWEPWLLQAVWWIAVIALFWATLRDGRRARGLALGFAVVGALAQAYRVVVFALAPTSDLISLSRAFLADYPYVASLAFFLLWVGLLAWAISGVAWIRRAFTRIARFDLPVVGILVFLGLFFGLRETVVTTAAFGSGSRSPWLDAIDWTALFLPLLLYIPFLMFQVARQRRRALEWALVGAAILLTAWFSRGVPAIDRWLEDAGIVLICVGLLGWILPRTVRSPFPSPPMTPSEPGFPSEN